MIISYEKSNFIHFIGNFIRVNGIFFNVYLHSYPFLLYNATFRYIVSISFIGKGNRSTQEKHYKSLIWNWIFFYHIFLSNTQHESKESNSQTVVLTGTFFGFPALTFVSLGQMFWKFYTMFTDYKGSVCVNPSTVLYNTVMATVIHIN